jgi:hypothetical protein
MEGDEHEHRDNDYPQAHNSVDVGLLAQNHCDVGDLFVLVVRYHLDRDGPARHLEDGVV